MASAARGALPRSAADESLSSPHVSPDSERGCSRAEPKPRSSGGCGETKVAGASATAVSPGEPATPRQKAFLTYMGTPFKSDLTKEQAALLVNDAMENGKNGGKLKRWDDERLRLYPDLFAEEIKAKRENRAQHFLEACQGEGAEFFEGVTKAHTQVLVGYLDVRFPNWDKEERSAKYDYLFPAISEKFPQLLTKHAKGRFKYPEGPRVAAELVRQPVAVTCPLKPVLFRSRGAGRDLWRDRAWIDHCRREVRPG